MSIKILHPHDNLSHNLLHSLLISVDLSPGIHKSLQTVLSPVVADLSVSASNVLGHLSAQEPFLKGSLGLHKLNVFSSDFLINTGLFKNLSHFFKSSVGSA